MVAVEDAVVVGTSFVFGKEGSGAPEEAVEEVGMVAVDPSLGVGTEGDVAATVKVAEEGVTVARVLDETEVDGTKGAATGRGETEVDAAVDVDETIEAV